MQGEEVRLTMPATPQLLRVARLTAAAPGLALAAQPDLLAVLDAGRDPHGHRLAVRGELHGRPLNRVPERQARTGDDVTAALGGTATESAPAEHVLQDVLEAAPATGPGVSGPLERGASRQAVVGEQDPARVQGDVAGEAVHPLDHVEQQAQLPRIDVQPLKLR